MTKEIRVDGIVYGASSVDVVNETNGEGVEVVLRLPFADREEAGRWLARHVRGA